MADYNVSCSVGLGLSSAPRGYFQLAPGQAMGRYRVANDNLERYELYHGKDAEPDFDAEPYETFGTLPHSLVFFLLATASGHWKMDDNADNDVVIDSSANGNHATYHADMEGEPPFNFHYTSVNHDDDAAVGTGALKLLDAYEGNANTVIQIPDDASNRFGTGDCSLSFWIKAKKSWFNPYDRVFYKGPNFDLWVGGQQPTRLIFHFGLSDNTFSIDYADVFGSFEAVWCHILVVRNAAAGRIYVYVNGVLATDVDTGLTYAEGTIANIDYSGSDIFVGAKDAAFTNKASIIIDDVVLFPKALTAAGAAYLAAGKTEQSPEGKHYFVLRNRNKFGLASQNFKSWMLQLDAGAGQLQPLPAAPHNIGIKPAAGGAGLVESQYLYDENDPWAATHWLIYFTDDGIDPDPESDTPTVVAMQKTTGGLASLRWTTPAADNNDTLKVLVRTRRVEGETNYDSDNTEIYSCTASTQGPASVAGRALLGRSAEAK